MKASFTVHTPINTTQIFLVWDPPYTGQFKLNVDGSCQCASGVIGIEGVIRDDKGNWIGGFVANMGRGDILAVEI